MLFQMTEFEMKTFPVLDFKLQNLKFLHPNVSLQNSSMASVDKNKFLGGTCRFTF